MAEVNMGLRALLKRQAIGIPVTVDIIEVPPAPEPTVGIVFVVYEEQVMPLPKLDRQVLMARLQALKQTVQSAGMHSEVIGRPGSPDAL